VLTIVLDGDFCQILIINVCMWVFCDFEELF